jgi:dipeptidyl aminopeptidase/acylaminoacyl peptidase
LIHNDVAFEVRNLYNFNSYNEMNWRCPVKTCSFVLALIFISIAASGCSSIVAVSPTTTDSLVAPTINQISTSSSTLILTKPATPYKPITLEEHSRIAYAVLSDEFMGIGLVRGNEQGNKSLVFGTPAHEGIYSTPTWSPDGQRIAFLSDYAAEDKTHCPACYMEDIFIVNLDGTDIKRLTNDKNFKAGLSWSPDGVYIVYAAKNYGEESDLFIINADSKIKKQLTKTPQSESNPSWSPDGSKIAYIEWEDNSKGAILSIIDKDGSNKRHLTGIKVGQGSLAWSPDSNQIAFRSFDGCGDIYVVNVDGGKLKQLTHMPGGEMDPTWSSDGNYIAFVASDFVCEQGLDQYSIGDSDFLGQQLYIMKSDGSNVTNISPSYSSDASVYKPQWSPVPSLHIEGVYLLSIAGDNLNLRDSPSLSGNKLTQLRSGDSIEVLGGPSNTDGYYWWKVRTSNGLEGWVVDVVNWYQEFDNRNK